MGLCPWQRGQLADERQDKLKLYPANSSTLPFIINPVNQKFCTQYLKKHEKAIHLLTDPTGNSRICPAGSFIHAIYVQQAGG